MERGKRYDVNVIYNYARSRLSSTDDTKLSQKITEFLVKKVESWGHNKTYYHDRDALPGKNMFDELFSVVKGSEWTVVILTRGFRENCWAKYCQLAAFKTLLDKENADKLIPVVVGLADGEIPDNLKVGLIIYFDPGDWSNDTIKNREEWKKLKDRLERNKPSNETPQKRDTAKHSGVQDTAAPGKLPQKELESVLRIEDPEFRQDYSLSVGPLKNYTYKNPLMTNVPASTTQASGDPETIDGSASTTQESGDPEMIDGPASTMREIGDGAEAIDNNSSVSSTASDYDETSVKQMNNSAENGSVTEIRGTPAGIIASPRTSFQNIRGSHCERSESSLRQTGSMDFEDLTEDNGSFRSNSSQLVSPVQSAIAPNEEARNKRDYSHFNQGAGHQIQQKVASTSGSATVVADHQTQKVKSTSGSVTAVVENKPNDRISTVLNERKDAKQTTSTLVPERAAFPTHRNPLVSPDYTKETSVKMQAASSCYTSSGKNSLTRGAKNKVQSNENQSGRDFQKQPSKEENDNNSFSTGNGDSGIDDDSLDLAPAAALDPKSIDGEKLSDSSTAIDKRTGESELASDQGIEELTNGDNNASGRTGQQKSMLYKFGRSVLKMVSSPDQIDLG